MAHRMTDTVPSTTAFDVDILEIAASWSFWDGSPFAPATVPRRVSLPHTLRDSLCLVVQGVRRCGKSTLLRQMVDLYALNPAHCAFLNLEDPRLSNALHFPLLDRLVEAFRGRHRDAERLYFFLDEIQGVVGWEKWLRAQLDRPAGNVFVITGSNANLLSGELSTVLTGRHLTVELFPFDLREARVRLPGTTLESHLHRGGFPEPLDTDDADRLLRQYFHDIVDRDIRERVGARSSLPVRQVVQMAFESAGSEMSLRRIAAATGVAIDTAAKYLEAGEAAYLLFGVPYFAYSARKRASRNKKYYPVDTGLRRVVATQGGADRGKALECAVLVALRRRFTDICYWRGMHEVDFVVVSGGRPVPLQVTWDGPQDRHQRGLDEFYEAFPQAGEAVFITASTFETELDRLEA